MRLNPTASAPTRSVLAILAFATTVGVGLADAAEGRAQSTQALRGIVTNAVTGMAIGGATVTDSARLRSTRTDGMGEFVLSIPSGSKTVLTLQAVGYTAGQVVVELVVADTTVHRLTLSPLGQELSVVPVITARPAPPRLSEFEERRTFGQGRFITDSMLEKNRNRRMSEILSTIPGPRVVRGMTNAAWVAGSRGSGSTRKSGFAPTDMDSRRGAIKACYATVVLDGNYVFSGRSGEQLFDVNSIEATQVAGIEFYSGASTVPLKFRGADTGCGLLIIWTK